MPVTINGSSGITANDGSVFTNSSGNVGIGTGSPVRTLDVRGYVSCSDGTTRTEMVNGGGVGYIGTQSNHPLAIQTNNAEVMRIATNGQQSSIIPGFGTVYQQFQCRAWVNWNGTTNTIRGSGNVSSITINTTGDYTVNFTTAMPDVNYAISGYAGYFGNTTSWVCGRPNGSTSDYTTSSCRVVTSYQNTLLTAYTGYVTVCIFR